MRKLIFAGVTDDKCFVHYEHGGFAAHSDLVLFKVISFTKADPTSQLICFDFGDEAIHDLDGLRKMISANGCKNFNDHGGHIPD